jgi:hypothetical protein
MKVHNAGSYGAANLMVRPGMDEPDDERWFKLETDEHGEPRRFARKILVRFEDGAAEVDDELGRYLLEKGLASAEPLQTDAQRPPRAAELSAGQYSQDGKKVISPEWNEVYAAPKRKAPIAVGSTMTPDVARSQVTYLGERIRG